MDENYFRDRLEMYSRRQTSRENSFNRDIGLNNRDSRNRQISHSSGTNQQNQQQSSFSHDDNNAITPIPTISGSTPQSLVVTRTPSNLSKSSKTKDRRKKSGTGSELTDKGDGSRRPSRRRLSNVLTSSFLRKKRIEYAGIDD